MGSAFDPIRSRVSALSAALQQLGSGAGLANLWPPDAQFDLALYVSKSHAPLTAFPTERTELEEGALAIPDSPSAAAPFLLWRQQGARDVFVLSFTVLIFLICTFAKL